MEEYVREHIVKLKFDLVKEVCFNTYSDKELDQKIDLLVEELKFKVGQLLEAELELNSVDVN